ncbi:hypothetical protein GCM10022288_26890 [Gryllotalpicola kribbensis]|uniref:Uncharacterized protein n=1 Tax=Gryllotalpicola kribbensis TaxID=993084 RepID=A0ABP8AY05_9MICO
MDAYAGRHRKYEQPCREVGNLSATRALAPREERRRVETGRQKKLLGDGSRGMRGE